MSLDQFNITCPECGEEFPLTETLAKPLITAERAKAQEEVKKHVEALKKQEQGLSQRQKALDDLKARLDARQTEIETAVQEKLATERNALTQAAYKTAADAYAEKLLAAEQELSEKDSKLAEADQAELKLRRERRLLEEEKRKLELQVERRLEEETLRVREATQREEEEVYRLKLAEKDKLLLDMKKQVEELRRKSDQTSQQLQGEVQELELEAMLKAAFPGDLIEEVGKGRAGGDVVQTVIGPNGFECGVILWESKRTRSWSNDWLAKNRADQRSVGAQTGVIITTTMPKGVDGFDRIDNVWVGSMRHAVPLAKALRQGIIEAAMVKLSEQGREGKMAMMYDYLTSSHFRARVSAIVEACVGMQEDLDAEKRALTKQWAKRQRRIELLTNGTAGLYGDLQTVIGSPMPEVQGLTLPLLGGGPEPTSVEQPDSDDHKESA